IQKIFLPENVTKTLGLEEINLDRLGPVVALVGKNGSGKSRLLQLVETNFPKDLTMHDIMMERIIIPTRLLDPTINSLRRQFVNTIIMKISKITTNKSYS